MSQSVANAIESDDPKKLYKQFYKDPKIFNILIFFQTLARKLYVNMILLWNGPLPKSFEDSMILKMMESSDEIFVETLLNQLKLESKIRNVFMLFVTILLLFLHYSHFSEYLTLICKYMDIYKEEIQIVLWYLKFVSLYLFYAFVKYLKKLYFEYKKSIMKFNEVNAFTEINNFFNKEN